MSSGLSLPTAYRAVVYDRVGSTNDVAAGLAGEGAGEFTLVVANEQGSGRGRRGRTWASPPGNLYCSVILRPRVEPAVAAQSGFVAAVAVAEAIAEVGGNGVALKWPNDVMLSGRKIAGILPECRIADNRLAWIVLGLGLNVAATPPVEQSEYPASSLLENGIATSPARLLEAYAPRLLEWYARWVGEGFAPVRSRWLEWATHGRGSEITVHLPEGLLRGRFSDMGDDGSLVVNLGEDGDRRILAGEIFAPGH